VARTRSCCGWPSSPHVSVKLILSSLFDSCCIIFVNVNPVLSGLFDSCCRMFVSVKLVLSGLFDSCCRIFVSVKLVLSSFITVILFFKIKVSLFKPNPTEENSKDETVRMETYKIGLLMVDNH